MGRAPCCSKVGLRRGPWSIKEDTVLTNYIQEHGEGQWRSLPKNAGLLRCGKSCRLRWMNYLRPGIKRGDISQDEEDLIVRLHGLLGNRWSLIAGRLPGRTDNEIKNYWNTHLIKKLKNAGLNPKTINNNDSPKTTRSKKSTAAAAGGKRKKKQKKVNKTTAAEKLTGEVEAIKKKIEEEQINSTDNDPPKTKVYLPKAIRVSSVFSRTNSYDSLASGASSCDGGVAAATEVASYVPVAWPPLFELEDLNNGVVGGVEGDDFLGVGFVMPALRDQSDPMSDDVNMWERMYEEYFQLL